MFRKQAILATLLAALLLAACGGEPTALPTTAPAGSPTAPATARPTATGMTSPLATPVSPLATPPSPPSPSPTPPPAPGSAPSPSPTGPPAAAAATAGATAGGLTSYLGVNQVLDLAFDPESGALWAATTGGAARWDLETGSYVQYKAGNGPAGDGPGANYVTGVAVAPAGAPGGGVWFATGAGVSHFDGAAWTSYPMGQIAAAGTPQSVAVTADGTVWVGTTDGVGRYDPTSGTWTGYLPGGRAWDVAIAADGSLWFAGHGAGLERYDPATDEWTTYNQAPGDGASDGQPLQGITTVVAAPDGSVWAYENYDGVYRVDGDQVQKVLDEPNRVCDIAFPAESTDSLAESPDSLAESPDSLAESPDSLAESPDSAAWLATCGSLRSSYGGLAYRDESGAWTPVEGWHPLGRPAIQALALAPDGETLALGTSLGIAVADITGDGNGGADLAWRLLRGGPSHNWVTTAAVTPDGGVWFGFGTDSPGSGGGGTSRLDPDTGEWTYALGDLNVRVLALAPDGALWAGTGCSLQRLPASPDAAAAGGEWQTLAECGVLGNGNILDLAFGPGNVPLAEGEVWVATGMNLARRQGGEWVVFDRLVHSVAVAPDGTLWASGWQGSQDSQYVARYDGSAWTLTSDRSLSSLTVTPDGGVVWGIDAELGLVRFDGQAWQPVPGPGGQPAFGPLAVGPGGALWTARPVPARYQDGAWTPAAGAASAAAVEGIQVLAVAPGSGRDGTLWLATTTGIVQIAPAD